MDASLRVCGRGRIARGVRTHLFLIAQGERRNDRKENPQEKVQQGKEKG